MVTGSVSVKQPTESETIALYCVVWFGDAMGFVIVADDKPAEGTQ